MSHLVNDLNYITQLEASLKVIGDLWATGVLTQEEWAVLSLEVNAELEAQRRVIKSHANELMSKPDA